MHIYICSFLQRMHIASRVPKFLRAILPSDSLILEEESYNAFPYTKTTYKNVWLKDRFELTIESFHAPGAGTLENVCLIIISFFIYPH